MRRNEPTRRSLVILVLLSSLGFGCFFHGFFPVKPLVSGYTDAQAYSCDVSESIRPGEEPFSRLIFILVDALRSDFVFGPESKMDFARSLISDGRALAYTAIAQAPTVTLPRLKGLTTGSNPTFLDAILNIADEGSDFAALENADSWVRQLAVGNGTRRKLVFAGDDTWLRLFPPRWFAWSEGVSSFFVSDTQTVDSNVTRHLDSLFADHSSTPAAPPSDWDALIVHYLGLDHVGHLEGPKSSKMGPKQQEMDEVFQRLFVAAQERDRRDGRKTLLVLIGDHGMTEGGNHGGSTESETSSALLLASPSLRTTGEAVRVTQSSPYRFYETVQQVDLVPTLSVLFDLGIPRNSMGRVIGSALKRLRPSTFESGLSANVKQMVTVLRAAGVDENRLLCEAFTRLNRSYDASASSELDEEASVLFLGLAQDELLVSFGDYRMTYLSFALLLLALSAFGLTRLSYMAARRDSTPANQVVSAAFVLHLGSFFATSFIEEEHEYWYFFTASACILLALRPSRSSSERYSLVIAAAAVRLMRGWSHNGQKEFSNNSITAFLAQHSTITSALVCTSYLSVSCVPLFNLASIARAISKQKLPPTQLLPKALGFATLATLSSLQAIVGITLKLYGKRPGSSTSFGRLLTSIGIDAASTLARIGYLLAACNWILSTFLRRCGPKTSRCDYQALQLSSISLLLMSMTRPTNIPLFLLFWIQHFAIEQTSSSLPSSVFAFLSIAFQSCSFFALGGSNSLATVDLSQAYNGLTSYSFPLVTLFTYLSNFAGPIFFSLSARILAPHPTTHTIHTKTFFALSLATLCASAVHFRYHLFAFTVFSPAVLYKGIWWIGVQLGTNEGLSRLLLI